MEDLKPWILGISASHNGSACLLRGNKIISAIQEERLVGVKRAYLHGAENSLAIAYCLNNAGIKPSDLNLIVYCNPGWSEQPQHDIRFNPLLKIEENNIPVLKISHHLGHALSAFVTSGWEEAVALVVDGIGSCYADLSKEELESVQFNVFRGSEILSTYQFAGNLISPLKKHLVENYNWLHESVVNDPGMRKFGSLGGMYSSVAEQIFGDPTEAGKVMGLAPYGRPTIDISEFFIIHDDRFEFTNKVVQRFRHNERYPFHENEYQNLAASVQLALEEALLYMIHDLRKNTLIHNLVLAGGVALNSVANERIIRESGFKNVFIIPAAEDSGPSIGAAYFGLWHLTKKHISAKLTKDSFGKKYTASEIDNAIKKIPQINVHESNRIIDDAVDLLIEGKIIAWFSGGSELGPRALGYRSILCNPCLPDAKNIINAKIKYRESFRPFAPSILLEEVHNWFELNNVDPESPFMLRVMKFQKDKMSKIPAVVHVDGTGRVQTVTAESNGYYYELIKKFYKKTGIPILLNTSLNIKGEPIAETPEDALWALLFTGLDACILENRLATKKSSFVSPLDLYPELVYPKPILKKDNQGNIQVQWETQWGICRANMPKSHQYLIAVLSIINGEINGWEIMKKISKLASREITNLKTIHILAQLRRLHWINFSELQYNK